MNLIVNEIRGSIVWDDLYCVLEQIDLDFIGENGSEYFADNGNTYFENAIIEAKKYVFLEEKIEHVLEACKNYNKNYYSEFEYRVTYDNNKDIFTVIIATQN